MYVRGSNPVWSFVNLTGRQFDDTYFMFVLQNTLPYLPAKVYHEPDGVAWTQPIQFFPNGTLPIDIFFDPGSEEQPNVYRLEFRQGPTQSSPLIYLVENYIPGNGTGGIPTDIGFSTDNQITNAQFSRVNFTTPLSLQSTSTIQVQIGPGWLLVLDASGILGSATISQVALNNSSLTPSNAPYCLRLNLSGWTGAQLIQQFSQNGVEWANKQVSCALTAQIQDAPSANINAIIVSSNGTTQGQLLTNALITGSFTEVTGHALLPPSDNSNIPPAAYLQFQILLPGSIDIFLTSIQVVASNVPIEFSYNQDTIERQVDHMFHYYEPQLRYKPIQSLLVGWDFPLNPRQFFTGTQTISSTTPAYVCDQTIVGCSSGTVAAANFPNTGAFAITTTANNQAFYLLQYLSGADALRTTLGDLSANINCYSLLGAGVVAKVFLYYSTPSGTIPAISGGTIGTVSADGTFNLTASNWLLTPQAPGFSNSVLLPLTQLDGMGLSGWNSSSVNFGLSSTNNFAIVVTFQVPTSGTEVSINSISCNLGTIPTVPAPQTQDEVLRQCQLYYEISSPFAGAPASSGYPNCVSFPMQTFIRADVGQTTAYPAAFSLEYKATKRAIPNITVYSANVGTSAKVSSTIYYTTVAGGYNASTNDFNLSLWTASIGNSSAYYFPNSLTNIGQIASVIPGTSGPVFGNSEISFNYIIDARLGVV